MLAPTTIEESLDREYVMMRLLSSSSPEFAVALKEVINRFSHLKSMILLPETLLFLPTTGPRTRTRNVYLVEFYTHKFAVKINFKVVPYTNIGNGFAWRNDHVKLKTPEKIYDYDITDITIYSGKDRLSLSQVFPGSLISFDRAKREFMERFSSSLNTLTGYDLNTYERYLNDDTRAQRLNALFYKPDDAIQYMSEGMHYLKEKDFLPNLTTR